jgi:chromosome segregation ATPase
MIIDEVKSQGQSVSEKQETMLMDFGEKIVKNVESKIDKAKFQSEEILESITKAGKNLLEKQEEKIDKFNSTLDERISRQLTILIDRGQLQLDALEARIASYVHEVKSNIESNLKIAREDSERQIANFNSQIIKSYKEIESANNHFLDASRKEFARTKDDFISMKNGIESEINRANELKNNLYSFIADEGAKFQNQKIKSEEIGENLSRTNRSLETLNKKTDEMKDKILVLDSIDEKIKKLSEIQKDFETKASNLEEVNGKIKSITESLLIVESNEADASFKLTEILEDLEEIQKIEKELHGTIQNIELKTAFLQGRDMDIKSIESKFDKVENLMMDLSARHKQIATMQNRLESLKTETESMKNSLEGLLDEADVRFEKLTDFLSVVDTVTSPFNQKAKVPSTGSKNDSEVMKKKKATVLQLHENFDWNSDTIASKLNMEKSFVELIINSKK